jgi:hypothetical protein
MIVIMVWIYGADVAEIGGVYWVAGVKVNCCPVILARFHFI